MSGEPVTLSVIWAGDTLRVNQSEPFTVRRLVMHRDASLRVIDDQGQLKTLQETDHLERRLPSREDWTVSCLT